METLITLTPVHLYGEVSMLGEAARKTKGYSPYPVLYSERKDVTLRKQVTVPITHDGNLPRRERQAVRTENSQTLPRRNYFIWNVV